MMVLLNRSNNPIRQISSHPQDKSKQVSPRTSSLQVGPRQGINPDLAAVKKVSRVKAAASKGNPARVVMI